MRIRTAALVTAAVFFAAAAIGLCWSGTSVKAFAYWLGVCLAGELLWIRLPMSTATISMASCFNFAALLVLSRGEAMLITALSTLAAELTFMRKPPVRALFNSAQTALAVWSASWAFQILGGGSRDLVAMLSSFHFGPVVFAAVAYYLVNRTAVSLAIASSSGLTPYQAWRRNFGTRFELLAAGAVLSLGAMLATHYSAIGMAGTLLVALPLVLACEGMRRFSQRPSAGANREAEPKQRRAA
jgi:hypothetical protein